MNRRVASALAASLVLACASTDVLPKAIRFEFADPPELGQEVGQLPESTRSEVIASADTIPTYEVLAEGVLYTIGVRKGSTRVSYISTSDPKFVSAEGLRVGETLVEVLAAGGTQPLEERGFAYLSELPSGWAAGFAVMQLQDGQFVDVDLDDESPVGWFMQRE